MRGNPINAVRASQFMDRFSHCGFLDLGFSGPKYTWINSRITGSLIRERLDRCWANSDWCMLYPNAHVFHLPHTHSDHCPVLNFESSQVFNRVKPFRFESFWLTDPSIFRILQVLICLFLEFKIGISILLVTFLPINGKSMPGFWALKRPLLLGPVFFSLIWNAFLLLNLTMF